MQLPILPLAVLALLGQGGGTSPKPASDDGIWSLAGRQVLCLRATVDSMTPARRVDELDDRLTNILSKQDGPILASDIVLRREKGTLSIVVKGDLLVTVCAGDAEANRMKPEKLARLWLSNVRKTVPQVSSKENRRGA